MAYTYKELSVDKKINISALYTAFLRRCEKDYYFDGEAHNFWEIVFVLDGSVGATADDDIYSLHAGQMIIHKPMEFHRLWSEGDTEPLICVFSFHAQNMPQLDGRVYTMSANDHARIKDLCESFHRHYDMDVGRINDNNIKMYFSGICEDSKNNAYCDVCYLQYILMKIIARGADLGVGDDSPAARKYAEIIGVMENNIHKRLCIDDIATMCKMSVSNVKKVFYRYSGKGVAGYFKELKIRHSLEMLQSGMSINEISVALGFDDQNYFSTVFKRIMGQSPMKYKKENPRGE